MSLESLLMSIELLQAVTDFAVAEFYNTLAENLQNIKPEIPLFIYKFQYESNLNDFSNLIRSKCVSKLKGKKIYFSQRIFYFVLNNQFFLNQRIISPGSFHADDVFYWMNRGQPLTKTDKFLVDLITKLFCNFARNG